MQCAENQVAGERSVDGHLSRLFVANLTDQDDIRIVPQEAPQAAGKIQPDAVIDLHLADAFQVVLDGIFDGQNLDGLGLNHVQG